MQHPVGAVVPCSWPWMGPLDQLDLSSVLDLFLGEGGWVGIPPFQYGKKR